MFFTKARFCHRGWQHGRGRFEVVHWIHHRLLIEQSARDLHCSVYGTEHLLMPGDYPYGYLAFHRLSEPQWLLLQSIAMSYLVLHYVLKLLNDSEKFLSGAVTLESIISHGSGQLDKDVPDHQCRWLGMGWYEASWASFYSVGSHHKN